MGQQQQLVASGCLPGKNCLGESYSVTLTLISTDSRVELAQLSSAEREASTTLLQVHRFWLHSSDEETVQTTKTKASIQTNAYESQWLGRPWKAAAGRVDR